MIQLIDYLRERPRAARSLFYAIVFAVLIWCLTVDASHGHTWAERHILGFWALFGIAAAAVLIFVARWFAGCGIARREDYYDN